MVGVETGDSPQSLMLERYSTNYDALIAPITSLLALITILMKTARTVGYHSSIFRAEGFI